MKHVHIITNSSEFNIIYLACDAGFTGINCDSKCRYPLFGNDCQSLCDCNTTFCDHVNGCMESSESKVPHQYYPLSLI